jgi:ribonuclease-3
MNIEVKFDFSLESLERRLNYSFKDINLLKNALLHRSFGNENRKYKRVNNERLELLGDAVLDLAVAEYLYLHNEDYTEGDLARIKSMVVSGPVFAKISRKLELGKYLKLSKGELMTGGQDRNSTLCDTFEAVIGAIYLDSNFEESKKVGISFLQYEIEHFDEDEEITDYKTTLQEFVQKKYKIVPDYVVVKESGPDHKKTFEIVVKIGLDKEGFGVGKSKKAAEHAAAKDLLKKIEEEKDETL